MSDCLIPGDFFSQSSGVGRLLCGFTDSLRRRAAYSLSALRLRRSTETTR
jgi:hypothetical protein